MTATAMIKRMTTPTANRAKARHLCTRACGLELGSLHVADLGDCIPQHPYGGPRSRAMFCEMTSESARAGYAEECADEMPRDRM